MDTPTSQEDLNAESVGDDDNDEDDDGDKSDEDDDDDEAPLSVGQKVRATSTWYATLVDSETPPGVGHVYWFSRNGPIVSVALSNCLNHYTSHTVHPRG
jgi:hypothetical protein